MRFDGYVETVEIGSGFGGLDSFIERPAVGAARVFEQNDAIVVAGVGGGVRHGRDVHVALDDEALADLQMMDGAPGLLIGDLDARRLVSGVGEQTALTGMDRIEQAFAGKFAALKDGEAARVEGELRLVFEPDGAKRARIAAAPEGDVLGWQFLLKDRHHGRLVFVDRDGLGEGVLEEIVECVGGDVALGDGVGGAIDASASISTCASTEDRSDDAA